MNKNIKELIRLIEKHPEKEIVFMVDSEVCASDEFKWWRAWAGKPYTDELYIDDEEMHFKSDPDGLIDKYSEELAYETHGLEQIGDEAIEKLDTLVDKEIEKLNWKKVIVVEIGV